MNSLTTLKETLTISLHLTTLLFIYSFINPSSPHNPSHFLKIPLNIILPSTFGSPQWSPSLRLPHQNPVFENRVLRGVFGPKGDEVTGE
jgi:hypothetical protein